MEGRPDLVVDAEPSEKWSFYSGSQNLASVLNDPSLPRSDIFTKDWGANFLEMSPMLSLYSSLPKDWSALDPYRKRIRRREERREEARKENAGLKSIDSSPQDIQETIPILFLQSDFNLENVITFNAMISSTFFPLSLSSSQLGPTSSAGSSQEAKSTRLSEQPSGESLKESIKHISKNLTDYLDVVEDNLSRQISKRFREFFHIMNAIDLVMDNLSKTIKQVTLLRHKCHQLQDTFVKPNLENIKLHRARQNALQVVEKLQLMFTISQTQPTIQSLLSNSDFAGSLDLISTTQDVFTQELLGLSCFRHLHSQLAEIRDIISKMMKEEFIKFIDAFCNKPLSDSSFEIKFIPQSERLEALIMGMLKTGCFSFIDDFNKEARIAIKALLKQTVIEMLSQEDDIEFDGKEEGSLFEKLKDVETDKWLQLLSAIFNNLNLLLQKMELIQKIMKKAVQDSCEKRSEENLSSNCVSKYPSKNSRASSNDLDSNQLVINREYKKLIITINESLIAICEDAHNSCRDLIKYKADSGSLDRLSSSKFLQLSKSIESFTNQCEQRCGRRISTLESVLQNQADRFATRFHEERKRKLNSVLSVEPWKSLDPVPIDFQEMVEKFQDEKLATISISDFVKRNDSNKSPAKSSDHERRHIRKSFITLNEENFVVVSSMRTLVGVILEYCQCCNEITSLSMELFKRLLELLSHFNLQTNQLVLCGGALREAGLKAINTRNLFLCRRSLQLVIALLPYLESYFCDLLPSKRSSVIESFTRVKQNYCEHTSKIPEKVISMVRDFLVRELSKWDARPPVPSQPFHTVSQHFMRLHDNIQDVVPAPDLTDFFIKLNETFKEVLKIQLQRLKILNDGGPQHGLVTQEMTFYAINLHKLGKEITFSIDDLWS